MDTTPGRLDDEPLDDDLVEEVPRTLSQRRRDALFSDFLLFCCAFSAGAIVYAVVATLGDGPDVWTVSLSEELVFYGLLAGELFLLWNNGLRQGQRGHSIGKHRAGLAVVDVGTGRPTGAWRGLVRGGVVVLLADLAIAAVPVGFPTVLRRLTPDAWHLGFVTYVALAVLLVSALVPFHRRVADRLVGSEVVETDEPTSGLHRRLGTGLELLGVVGVLALSVVYVVTLSRLVQFPGFF